MFIRRKPENYSKLSACDFSFVKFLASKTQQTFALSMAPNRQQHPRKPFITSLEYNQICLAHRETKKKSPPCKSSKGQSASGKSNSKQGHVRSNGLLSPPAEPSPELKSQTDFYQVETKVLKLRRPGSPLRKEESTTSSATIQKLKRVFAVNSDDIKPLWLKRRKKNEISESPEELLLVPAELEPERLVGEKVYQAPPALSVQNAEMPTYRISSKRSFTNESEVVEHGLSRTSSKRPKRMPSEEHCACQEETRPFSIKRLRRSRRIDPNYEKNKPEYGLTSEQLEYVVQKRSRFMKKLPVCYPIFLIFSALSR